MSNAPLDLEQFRAPKSNDQPKPTSTPKRHRSHDARKWFLGGRVPGDWLRRACRLPKRAIVAALALWQLAGMEKSLRVKITWKAWDRFGISPHSGRRGLADLETAGLVAVDRPPGCCPVVTIQDAVRGHDQ